MRKSHFYATILWIIFEVIIYAGFALQQDNLDFLSWTTGALAGTTFLTAMAAMVSYFFFRIWDQQ